MLWFAIAFWGFCSRMRVVMKMVRNLCGRGCSPVFKLGGCHTLKISNDLQFPSPLLFFLAICLAPCRHLPLWPCHYFGCVPPPLTSSLTGVDVPTPPPHLPPHQTLALLMSVCPFPRLHCSDGPGPGSLTSAGWTASSRCTTDLRWSSCRRR